MTDFVFNRLTLGKYRLILADPPWTFRTFSEAGQEKSPQAHYGCMDERAIHALPVAPLAHPDGCILVLWGTAPMIEQAHRTMAAWGFTYKTMGAWAKLSKTGNKWAFGTGFLLRSAAEFWLIGTRGKPPRGALNVRNLIAAPVREHSRKPEEMREVCEQLSSGPYAELFARERAPGWDSWGNEIGKFEGGLRASLAALSAALDAAQEARK